MTLKLLLWIGLGGFAGSIVRFGFGVVAQKIVGLSQWPLGTFLANAAACFILGILFAYSLRFPDWDQATRTGLMVGFCGGLSTFSTFTMETFQWIQEGRWLMAGLYILCSVVVCFLSLILGMQLQR
jgi:fluoride exporter